MEERLLELIRKVLMKKATDVYFELRNGELRVEMKAGDHVEKVEGYDVAFFTYLQYRAHLDMGNVSAPQTGQFEVEVAGRIVSLRFAVMNSFRLTSGVLRILNHVSMLKSEDLTFESKVIRYLQSICQQRSGLFLFSGPTGSGKTTTLYTLLSEVQDRKIFTIEDPIEVYFDDFVQIQVNEKAGMGYGECIKQLMRHRPDIIMIGEIRDSEAAKNAVRCALTGHLVVSTVHAGDVLTAIERMLELGCERNQLKDVLCGVSNQRLFTLSNDRKVGIYEFINEKQIADYLKDREVHYVSLATKIAMAEEVGLIPKGQYAE